jgi:hypothetical protein
VAIQQIKFKKYAKNIVFINWIATQSFALLAMTLFLINTFQQAKKLSSLPLFKNLAKEPFNLKAT